MSVRGVGLGGCVHHGVGQDAVGEVLEGLSVLFREAVSVLVALRNFTTRRQPRLSSDICESWGVVCDRLLGPEDRVRVLTLRPLSWLLISNEDRLMTLFY